MLVHTKFPCAHCGRGLMPIKNTDWDTRKYHKKCFLELKAIELAEKMQQQLYIDEYRRFEIINKLKRKF